MTCAYPISTYWKVVNKAYLFWESFNLLATVCLNLDIFYLVSILYPWFAEDMLCDCAWGCGLGAYFLGYDLGASVFWTGCYLGAYFEVYWVGFDYCGFDDPYGFFPYGSTSKNGFPTSKVSPAATWNLDNTPAIGLFI